MVVVVVVVVSSSGGGSSSNNSSSSRSSTSSSGGSSSSSGSGGGSSSSSGSKSVQSILVFLVLPSNQPLLSPLSIQHTYHLQTLYHAKQLTFYLVQISM